MADKTIAWYGPDSGAVPVVAKDNGDGTYTPAVREQYVPNAEDNTNNTIAVTPKPVAASAYSPSINVSFGSATKANAKASAGAVIAAYVTNVNAAVRYFQIHNKASAPAGTDVPVRSFPIPAGSATVPGVLILTREFFNNYYLGTGVGWAISTTNATFTDSATASEHNVDLSYV